MTPANRYRTSDNLGALAYVKPSILLLALRNKVLGAEVFDSAFREYTRRWAFKHPQPADFFRTIEEVSGRDLAWFWRGFFYTTAALDQSVESVKQTPDGAVQPGCCAINCTNHREVYSFHPGGANVLMADGSVHFLNASIDIRVFAHLVTRAGGEVVSAGDY